MRRRRSSEYFGSYFPIQLMYKIAKEENLVANLQFSDLTAAQHKNAKFGINLVLLSWEAYLILRDIKILVFDWLWPVGGRPVAAATDSTRSYFISHNRSCRRPIGRRRPGRVGYHKLGCGEGEGLDGWAGEGGARRRTRSAEREVGGLGELGGLGQARRAGAG
jgi:hypothetical protein